MNQLLEEQLALHFGSDYERIREEAKHYLGGLLSHASLRRHRQRIMNNEGGHPQMVANILLLITEKGEMEAGFKAYASHLEQEYNDTGNRSPTHHAKWHELGENIESIEVGPNESPIPPTPPSVGCRGSSGNEHPFRPHECILVSDDEKELFDILAQLGYVPGKTRGRSPSYGLIVEACGILDWPVAKGQRIRERVLRRAARAAPPA